MNSTYSRLGNSKALVTNEDGKQRFVDNYDNINEILIEENIIESIENKVNELEEQNKKYEKKNKRKYIPMMLFISVFFTKIILPSFFSTIDFDNFALLSTIIQFDEMCFLSSSIIISLAIGTDIGIFIKHRNNIKKQKGIKSELLYLNRRLKSEKRVMRNLLKRSKYIENGKWECNLAVRSGDKIDDLNKYLELYYNIGYNSDRYYNYYLNGKINEVMKKNILKKIQV